MNEFQLQMTNHKLCPFDAFKEMDKNNDGFITFNEFNAELDKIIQVDYNTKKGIFAFFDKLKIGMFDY